MARIGRMIQFAGLRRGPRSRIAAARMAPSSGDIDAPSLPNIAAHRAVSDLLQTRPAAAPAERVPLSVDNALSVTAMLIAGAFVGYFLFTGMPALTFEVFPRTLTNHLVYAGAAVVYVVYLAIARRLPGGSPLDVPVLGFIAAFAIATFASIDWRLSLEATLQLGAAIIIFYALADLPFLSAMQLQRAIVLVAAALSIYALWVVGNDYADYLRLVRDVEGLDAGNIFPPTVPRVHDVSDHPNVLAMLLVLMMPFVAHAAMRGQTIIERIAAAVAFAVAAMAIFLTLSRGGWLGVFAGVGFTVIGVWLTARAYDREQQGFAPSWTNAIPRDISPTAIATLGGAAALAVGGTLAFLSSSTTRPGWLFRSSLSPREDAWESGLEMFADNPLFGSGPHTFGLLYPQYSGRFLVHTQHAHNGFLQLANDAGILGLLALLGVALAIVYMLAKTWREGSLDQRALAVACAGALIGFTVHNQLDAGNIWKAPAVALALVAAIIVRNYRERPAQPEQVPAPEDVAGRDRRFAIPDPWPRYATRAARSLLLLLIALPFIGWWRIDRAQHDHWLGADAANNGRYAEAIPRLQDAVNADSSMMVYQLDLGRAQANLCLQLSPCDENLLDAAILHLERAADIDPRSDIARANLARAYQLAGREEDAAREAQISRLAAHHVTPVLAAAEVYEDMGYEQEAVETYGQVLSMDASLADSEFWQMTDFRRDRYDDILAASIIGLNPCTNGALVVEQGHRDPAAAPAGLDDLEEGCKLLALGSPNDLVVRVALAKILMAQDKPDEAREHLQFAVDRQPDFGPARTELGRWYAAIGDLEEAKQQWVRGAELEQAESVMLLGETYPAGEVPASLRDDLKDLLNASASSVRNDLISVLYYRVRYQRLSPVSAMIDGDWRFAVPRLYIEMEQTLARWTTAAN
jgi:O-antigen ligase/tetratricopeptide (TPR) repeat protein